MKIEIVALQLFVIEVRMSCPLEIALFSFLKIITVLWCHVHSLTEVVAVECLKIPSHKILKEE